MFQSTHSRGVRQNVLMLFTENLCFNPRTHEECDRLHGCSYLSGSVSIHALTRSATVFTDPPYGMKKVSIHALTRSATKSDAVWFACTVVSIHALTRSATCIAPLELSTYFVSIHALTRSATCDGQAVRHIVRCFNPRTHEECDVEGGIYFGLGPSVSIHALTRSATKFKSQRLSFTMFQSTHSRGVRLPEAKAYEALKEFQSTHSRGVRPSVR